VQFTTGSEISVMGKLAGKEQQLIPQQRALSEIRPTSGNGLKLLCPANTER
jgi:hypothetical protein